MNDSKIEKQPFYNIMFKNERAQFNLIVTYSAFIVLTIVSKETHQTFDIEWKLPDSVTKSKCTELRRGYQG